VLAFQNSYVAVEIDVASNLLGYFFEDCNSKRKHAFCSKIFV